MHSEEDTFNKLRRLPHSELIYRTASVSSLEWTNMTKADKEEFFKAYGWTYDEWLSHDDL